ncbi:MAG: glycosyltransferase [Gemmatimonadetes bacterium]|nr:glycosyltransferase [Gemmatimonadota bacterium]
MQEALSPAFLVAHNGARIYGGLEKWMLHLLAALHARGHRVLLLCRPEVARHAREHGVETRLCRLGGDVMIHDALRLARLLRRLAPDALLLTHYPKTWLGAMGGALARVPRIVARIGYAGYLPQRWKYRVAFRRWIHVSVANAEAVRRRFLADLPDLDPRRIVTIYNGVRAPERPEPPGTLRQALGLSDAAFVIGCLSRFAPDKRIDRLLYALAELPDRAHAILAGDGPERAALEALAVRLDVAGRAHFLGFRRDVGDVLDACDVLTIVSDVEGMSNAMLEAMAVGVPVVSTPVSGADEALDPFPDGTAPGTVTSGFEPGEIAAAVRRLVDHLTLRGRMADAARRRHAERFTFERMVEKWERLLVAGAVESLREGPPTHDSPAG